MEIRKLDYNLVSERSQALVRSGVASVVFIILAYLVLDAPPGETGGVQALLVVAVFWLMSIAWAWWVWHVEKSSMYRRVAGLLFDIAGTTLAFYLADNLSAFFYPVYQWIIIGHGIRYGKKAMLLACVLAVIGFSSVVFVTPYWQHNMLVASGLLLGLIVLPLYLLVLIKKMQELNERLQLELSKTYHHAIHDQLTGITNRQYFHNRLAELIDQAALDQCGFAVLFIDLDEFKEINDKLGHSAGDKVLKIIAERLKHNSRDNDVCSRLGGDEFGMIINNVSNCNDIEVMAQRLSQAISKPIALDHDVFYLGGSIGISIYPNDGKTTDELTHNADVAMYEAKRSGKNAYVCYSNRAGTANASAPGLSV